jgi:hypothetical protein
MGLQPRPLADRSGPVRTIAKALRLAVSGDHIVLADTGQPYRESISLVGVRHSGSMLQPLVIAGNGAVLDGSAPVPVDQWQHTGGGVYRFHPPRMGPQQLFLDDRPALRVAVSATADRAPKLAPRQWCVVQGDLFFRVEKGKMPADYRLTYAALPSGITLYQVDHVAITDLTVQDFQLDGVSALNSARNVHLTGVTCRGNGRNGLCVGGASQVEIDSCLLGNNGAAQLLTTPNSETHIYDSHLLGNTAAAWVDQGGRVWLGLARVTGGREAIKPEDAPRKTAPAPQPPPPGKVQSP